MRPSRPSSRRAASTMGTFTPAGVALLTALLTLGLAACDAVNKSVLEPTGLAEIDASKGSSILIEHEDGRRWEVTVEGGAKVVTELP